MLFTTFVFMKNPSLALRYLVFSWLLTPFFLRTQIVSSNSTVTDIEGQVYKTVKIGKQVWMAENLKTSKYRDGSKIPQVIDAKSWEHANTGAWSHVENNEKFNAVYGKLYNWYAVNDKKGLCPVGWAVPSDDDWKILESVYKMSDNDLDELEWRGTNQAIFLKDKGSTHWRENNSMSTNASGLSVLPAGSKRTLGQFFGLYSLAYLWAATEESQGSGWFRCFQDTKLNICREGIDKHFGLSVRCIQK